MFLGYDDFYEACEINNATRTDKPGISYPNCLFRKQLSFEIDIKCSVCAVRR